jgi:DNA helicase-2/ATP-dependent DNA helicase PcrA
VAQLADEILAALDDEQRAVATAVRGPVCVIAGAGTGKTRAITHRLAYAVDIGVVDPLRILALTFTARAAGEMRTRLRALGVPNIAARTFHSAALKQLMYFWPDVLGGRFPALLTTKSGFIGEALGRAGITATKSQAVLRDVAGEIEWSKVIGIAPDEYIRAVDDYGRAARIAQSKVEPRDIARIYDAYESLKKQERAIDFEDVLLLTVGMLEEERDVRERVRDQYRYFTIDEYQDVSPLQQRLLDLWVGKRTDICVVGDPAQTIYSFAGASPAFLLNFTNKYPGAEVIRLSTGYRSTPEIINTANAILRSADLGHDLDPINGHGEKPILDGFKNEKEEIEAVVSSIMADQKSEIQLFDIAVLARTNSQLEKFESALSAAGIENQIRTSERFFNRSEVKELISSIRSASVLSDPNGDWLADLRDAMKNSATSEYARALLNLGRELANDGVTNLRAFLREIEDRAEQNNPPTLPGVTLATLHGAKGLEWEKVYLVGASDGVLPWRGEALEEERRLFYVGITRAKKTLALSYSGVASPFLSEAGLTQ